MAGRIRSEDIESLRERADITTIVSDHTKLTRAGSRLKGLCPFHDEKTPSFTVDPARNLFHCFGCGEGGSIFDFVMRVLGVEFPEAVEHVARRSGFTLRYEELSAGERRTLGERSRLLEVLAAATTFYREQLAGRDGTPAREYLERRGFDRDDAERFRLGFAPLAWDALSRHLVRAGVARSDLVTAGLAVEGPRGLRDRFRGRLLFPVADPSGDVIGFGGRILPALDYGDHEPPKYYNSPETPLYRKQRVLYGVDVARPEVVRRGEVLVCEGYTDVLALHKAGLATAVATCGTAVGRDHLRLLGRYARRVVLAFDADAAGATAAQRAWTEARALEEELGDDGPGHAFELRVLPLPAGTDPADLVTTSGVDAVRTAVEGARGVLPFLIERHIATSDTSTPEARAVTLRGAVALLADEPDAELRRTYARTEIADRLGVSVEFVERTAERAGVELDRHTGVARVASAPRTGPSRGREGPRVRRARIERRVLSGALQHPEALPDEWYEVTVDHFEHPKARSVFAVLEKAGGPGVAVDAVLEAAPDDEVRALVRALVLDDTGGAGAAGLGDLVRWLLVERLLDEQRDLRDALALVNHQTDRERWVALNAELAALERRRRGLVEHD